MGDVTITPCVVSNERTIAEVMNESSESSSSGGCRTPKSSKEHIQLVERRSCFRAGRRTSIVSLLHKYRMRKIGMSRLVTLEHALSSAMTMVSVVPALLKPSSNRSQTWCKDPGEMHVMTCSALPASWSMQMARVRRCDIVGRCLKSLERASFDVSKSTIRTLRTLKMSDLTAFDDHDSSRSHAMGGFPHR